MPPLRTRFYNFRFPTPTDPERQKPRPFNARMEVMHQNKQPKQASKADFCLKLHMSIRKCDQLFLSNSWASCSTYARIKTLPSPLPLYLPPAASTSLKPARNGRKTPRGVWGRQTIKIFVHPDGERKFSFDGHYCMDLFYLTELRPATTKSTP